MDNKENKDLTAYDNRFHEDPTSFNDFQAADYIKELKNQGKNDEAIEVGRTFLEVAPELKRYINYFGYALYNRYINIEDEKIAENETLFFAILDEIANVCKQERYSPLEAAVNKAIKYVSKKNPVDYEKLSEILEYLDAPTLDDTPFINKEGREYESKKEKWYRMKVRALYEVKDYRNCIEQANIALTLPLKWHYNNLNWVKYYRGVSLIEVGRYEEAEHVFLELKNSFKIVNLSSVLYKLYVNTGRENDAYTYLINDFFLSGYDASNLDNYVAIAKMAHDKGVEKAEKIAAAMTNKIKSNAYETELDLSEYDNESADSLFDMLYSEIMYHLERYIKREEGKVIYYNNSRNFGSILQENEDDNLFFMQADFIDDEEVRKFDVVEFSRIATYDRKKKQASTKAVLLKVLYEDINY